MRDFLIISLGAVFGANARYVFSRFTAKMIGPAFPYGTLIINVVGSATSAVPRRNATRVFICMLPVNCSTIMLYQA